MLQPMLGACWALICPELFEEDPDDGRTAVAERYRIDGKIDEGSAPDRFKERLREIEEACPAEVIRASSVQLSFD